MGFLDFFRKKPEIRKEKTKILLNELDTVITNEHEKERTRIEKISYETYQQTASFITEIDQKIESLELINLQEKKEGERIKIITLENLKSYIKQLRLLSLNLKKLNENYTDYRYLTNLPNVLEDFRKNSHKSFERATILIGKELGDVKKVIIEFTQFVRNTTEGSAQTMQKLTHITTVKEMKDKENEIVKIQKDIKSFLTNLEKEHAVKDAEKEVLEKEISVFRESQEYRAAAQQKEKANAERFQLKQDAAKIKEKIDLKKVTKQFHESEKKRELLNAYRNDFLSALEADETLELAQLLSPEIKQQYEEELRRLKEKTNELQKQVFSTEAEKKEHALEEKIKICSTNMKELSQKIEDETKKAEKFKAKQEELKIEIAQKTADILTEYEIISD